MRFYIGLLLILLGFSLSAQGQSEFSIKGSVFGLKADGSREPLAGANLVWKGQQLGTISGVDGSFVLKRNPNTDSLIVSYISFRSDTILVGESKTLVVELLPGVEIEGAEIVHRQKTTTIGHFDLIRAENIGEEELCKAACCNLSESFETSPTVDVSFTDAISGTRQIRMLGLAGPYAQLTRENMPDIRGLAAINGMGFIPGTWIESIQLIQGAGSVVNGYESIAGQINTELHKSGSMDKFYLNLYTNSDRSTEANTHIRYPVGKQWSGALLLHGKYNSFRHDSNQDGFLDMPLNKSFVTLNRYEWENTHDIYLSVGARYTYKDQLGGQVDFEADQKMDSLNPWGMLNEIRKLDGWLKMGKVNSKKPWQSTALQVSGSIYQQNARYGLNEYNGEETTYYLNLIHQSRIANDKHQYKLGASFLYDDFNENLNLNNYQRLEKVPGVFGEYTYKPSENLGIVAGMRVDFHNEYGTFYTPRLHLRYEPAKKVVLRASAGRGMRTANIFAEHLSMLASSREIFIHSDNSGYGYGLEPEKAWNYGLNYTHTFELAYRDARISASFYHTDFENQIVFDMEQGPQEVHLYNLQGESYANSFQFQVDYELIRRLDLRMAYRYYDVRTTYNDELMSAPLLAPHRGFLNLAYGTSNYWKFDFTINIQGEKRIPDISDPGQIYERTTSSPIFAIVNAQVSKTWKENFDLYVGGENLGNFRQDDPIISAEDPYGPYFDASLIWGPLFGVKIYAGIRYKIH